MEGESVLQSVTNIKNAGFKGIGGEKLALKKLLLT